MKAVDPPRHPGAEDKRLHAEFRSGYVGVFLIHRSSAAARRRHRELVEGQSSAVLRKGPMVLAYSGSKGDATTLEDCLRESGEGDEPPRGELARQLSRIEARREADARQYRDRQYDTPEEIGNELERLRSYRRDRLYYLDERFRFSGRRQ